MMLFAMEVNSVVTMARFTAVVRWLSSQATIGPSRKKPEDRRLNPAVEGRGSNYENSESCFGGGHGHDGAEFFVGIRAGVGKQG